MLFKKTIINFGGALRPTLAGLLLFVDDAKGWLHDGQSDWEPDQVKGSAALALVLPDVREAVP
jgi:hypothetical protein